MKTSQISTIQLIYSDLIQYSFILYFVLYIVLSIINIQIDKVALR